MSGAGTAHSDLPTGRTQHVMHAVFMQCKSASCADYSNTSRLSCRPPQQAMLSRVWLVDRSNTGRATSRATGTCRPRRWPRPSGGRPWGRRPPLSWRICRSARPRVTHPCMHTSRFPPTSAPVPSTASKLLVCILFHHADLLGGDVFI